VVLIIHCLSAFKGGRFLPAFLFEKVTIQLLQSKTNPANRFLFHKNNAPQKLWQNAKVFRESNK
jgi:hypothetical protein